MLAGLLADVRHGQGRLLGRMETLGFDLRREAVLGTLVADVVKSSDIEGETLDASEVRSSIARRLGVDAGGVGRADRDVEGVVEMTLDATGRYERPLTVERLEAWHASLFPTGRSGMRRITVGGWRGGGSDPMRVVSGPVGRERVHFEAPPAARLDAEMRAFLDWFEAPGETDPVLGAGLAHLRLVTIHPSTTATAASPAPLPTWPWPARSGARSASTACRRRSARSAARTTRFWNGRSAARRT